MAKDLFIIRHAKSDWSFRVDDFDRPLNSRGFDDAPLMAKWLIEQEYKPDLLLSSPAKRALTTAQIFSEILRFPIQNIDTDARIYESNKQGVLEVINALRMELESVVLFGHNPTISELIAYLSDRTYEEIPTCGVVHLHFADAEHWNEISAGTGIILRYVYPKMLKS